MFTWQASNKVDILWSALMCSYEVCAWQKTNNSQRGKPMEESQSHFTLSFYFVLWLWGKTTTEKKHCKAMLGLRKILLIYCCQLWPGISLHQVILILRWQKNVCLGTNRQGRGVKLIVQYLSMIVNYTKNRTQFAAILLALPYIPSQQLLYCMESVYMLMTWYRVN